MEKDANKKPDQPPENHTRRDCCNDCVFLDTSDRLSDDRMYCEKWNKYIHGGESACSSFRKD